MYQERRGTILADELEHGIFINASTSPTLSAPLNSSSKEYGGGDNTTTISRTSSIVVDLKNTNTTDSQNNDEHQDQGQEDVNANNVKMNVDGRTRKVFIDLGFNCGNSYQRLKDEKLNGGSGWGIYLWAAKP